MAGIRLANAHDHDVVEAALYGKVDVHNFWQGQAHEWKEDSLDGLAHVGVFHRRLADDGGGVDGIFAVRDAGDVEDGIVVRRSVEAGVVAEGAFAAELIELNVAFENDLSGGGDLEVHGFALHQFDRLLAEESGDDELFDFGRSGNDGAECQRGIGADGDGDFHLARWLFAGSELSAAEGAGHDVHG